MDEKKSFFDVVSGKAAFGLGFLVAVFTICTLGFIVLAVMFFRGGFPSSGTQQVAQVQQQQQQQNQQQPDNTQPPTPAAPVTVSTGHFPVLGNKNAKVTLVEFADFRCPFCERFYTDVEKNIIKDYVNTGKVKYAFRSFAFLGPQSTDASIAAECINEQGTDKFWKFHDWMYEHQAPESDTGYYSKDNLIKYATAIPGVDKNKFSTCLNTSKDADKVAQDLSDGQTAGVSGTPTIFVNGVAIVGAVPYAQVKTAIDAALAK